MYIRTRLSFQFTFIVAGILLFFSTLVYYFSYSNQINKFRENLIGRAKNNAILLVNVTEVDSTLLKKIHKSTISFEEEEIAITDSAFSLLYDNDINYLSNFITSQNSIESDLEYFSISEKDGVYIKHHFNNRTYHVYVLAFDKSRREYLSELGEILFWSNMISILLSVLFAYTFSKKAMKPISDIIKSVKAINSLKLSSRLDEGNRKDEIAQLAMTFNEMLSNLEYAFKNQEDFVSNASHEIRTPLAVMIAESNYIITKELNAEEYKVHISSTVADLNILNKLLGNLLELAHINRDKSIVFSEIRIDEVIFNSIQQIKNRYPARKIIPSIQYPDVGNELIISGNEGLLNIAFNNLLDNACKFSNDDVLVNFLISDLSLSIIISDSGVGIPLTDIDNIFKPFKRADNVKFISGFGIGLTLVAKIMELHKAKINILSKEKVGTKIEINFARNNN